MREEVIPGQGYYQTLSEKQKEVHKMSGLEGLSKDERELTRKSELGAFPHLPRWQTEPVNLIEDVMARWLGSIRDEEAYQAVMDRLKYLRAYLPRLRGELLNRANTAVKLLEERISDYQRRNLQKFISEIAEFVKAPIEDDAGLKKAEEYLASLTEMRPALRGLWAQVVDKYAGFLKERITAYRERSPKIAEASPPGQELGSPEEVPEVLKPFFIVTDTSWAEHKADSGYCRVTTLQKDKEWLLGFEEGDENYALSDPSFKPDWDFDEPVLHLIRTDNVLNVTTQKYGGYIHACRVNYGTTVLFARVGGAAERHIGETIGLNLVTRQVVAPGKVPILSWQKILKALPWGITIGALGYTTYRVAKKK